MGSGGGDGEGDLNRAAGGGGSDAVVSGRSMGVRAGCVGDLVFVSRFFCFPIQMNLSGNVFSGENPEWRGAGPKSVGGPMRKERVQPIGGKRPISARLGPLTGFTAGVHCSNTAQIVPYL